MAASKEDSSSVTDSKLKNDEDVLDAYIVWGRGILSSFLKFYVMGSPEIDLFGVAHVKVEFIPVLKIDI